MLKLLIALTICSLLIPGITYAQVPTIEASLSSQSRNRLQLLSSPEKANLHFNRLSNRLSGILTRVKNIHTRIEARFGKIVATQTVKDRIRRDINRVESNIISLESEIDKLESSWNILIKNNSSTDFPGFKKSVSGIFDLLDAVITDQKNILKELKKYKSQISPTQKVATEGGGNTNL